jgi:O-antigen ligase
MKFPLSSIGGSKYPIPLITQVAVGIFIVILGFNLLGMGTIYFLLLFASLAVIPVLFTRLSVYLFAILLFLDAIMLGVFSYGGYQLLGLRATFFDLFILVSSLILLIRLREKASFRFLVPFLIFLLFFLLSVIHQPQILESGIRYFQLFALENFLILLLALLIIDTKRNARIVLGGVVVMMSLVALYFFYRYWQHGQIVISGAAGESESLVLAFPEGSDFSNRNSMAAMVLPVVIMLTVFAFELKSRPVRLVSAVIASLVFILVISSASRGAAVAAFGGIGFYLIMRFREGRLSLLPAIFIGLVVAALLMQTGIGKRMYDRVFSEEDNQIVLLEDYNRRSLITTSASLIQQHPLLGIGFDEQTFIKENELFNSSSVVWAHPHNSYLYLWVFGGSLSFIALLWVGFYLAAPIWRALRTRRDPLLMALAAALFGLLLDFGTDRTFFIGPISHLFFMLFAGAFIYAGFLLREEVEEE